MRRLWSVFDGVSKIHVVIIVVVVVVTVSIHAAFYGAVLCEVLELCIFFTS